MSYLSEFVAYMKTRTDAPVDFHLHGGMVSLAAALGNRVWCDGWSRPVYPNLWVVNIAPSGYGKSTTLDMSQMLLQKAGLGKHVLPGSFSQEGLTKRIQSESAGVWFIQEFASFLGTLGRDYNAGAMQWLTEIFDVPDVYDRVLSGESIVLRKPCVSILGASSPDWFAQSFKESALRGGFLARFIFCPSAKAGEYVGHPGPRNDATEAALAGHLQAVYASAGKVSMTKVLPLFREWDYVARERVRQECPPEFSGMRSRAGLLVLKAAMLFHASSDPESRELEPRDLQNAIKYVEDAHAKAEQYLTDEVARDKYEADRIAVVSTVRRAGGMCSRSKVLKDTHLRAAALDEAVNTLLQTGEIERIRRERTDFYMLAQFASSQRILSEVANSGSGLHLKGVAVG